MAIALLGIGASGAFGYGGTVAARPIIDPATYVLRGTGPFSESVAWATVTRLPGERFRLSLVAAHLPPPTMLRVRSARHAYVAWLVNGRVIGGPLGIGAVGLAATGGPGTFVGQGTVAISLVTSVIVTAEPTAQAHMPTMPVLTVLASTYHQMQASRPPHLEA
jgi:hypothetical protein